MSASTKKRAALHRCRIRWDGAHTVYFILAGEPEQRSAQRGAIGEGLTASVRAVPRVVAVVDVAIE